VYNLQQHATECHRLAQRMLLLLLLLMMMMMMRWNSELRDNGPASRVLIKNSLSSLAMPCVSARPPTFTLLALPISFWLTTTLNGEPGIGCPLRNTLTQWSPISRGVNEIPANRQTERSTHQAHILYVHCVIEMIPLNKRKPALNST